MSPCRKQRMLLVKSHSAEVYTAIFFHIGKERSIERIEVSSDNSDTKKSRKGLLYSLPCCIAMHLFVCYFFTPYFYIRNVIIALV